MARLASAMATLASGAVARRGRGFERLVGDHAALRRAAAARTSACPVSSSVVLPRSTLRLAALTEASARSTCAASRTVSSAASTSPFFTRWFSSTATERTTPDSSLEMSTWVSGCRVPVAETSTVRSAGFGRHRGVGDGWLGTPVEAIGKCRRHDGERRRRRVEPGPPAPASARRLCGRAPSAVSMADASSAAGRLTIWSIADPCGRKIPSEQRSCRFEGDYKLNFAHVAEQPATGDDHDSAQIPRLRRVHRQATGRQSAGRGARLRRSGHRRDAGHRARVQPVGIGVHPAAGESAASRRVRIFTPDYEMPFAGHPTVGSAIALAELAGERRAGIFVLEENIGPVRCAVDARRRRRLSPNSTCRSCRSRCRLSADAGGGRRGARARPARDRLREPSCRPFGRRACPM